LTRGMFCPLDQYFDAEAISPKLDECQMLLI